MARLVWRHHLRASLHPRRRQSSDRTHAAAYAVKIGSSGFSALRTRSSLSLAALLLTTFAATALLLARGPSCGHDFDFHLVSWLEVARGWHSGLLYPHWAASANFGAGEPRFVFYPPVSWMLGAVLGVVLPWTWVGFVFTALVLLGAAVSCRAMLLAWMSEETASLAACIYAV